jgi:hypothetical protein
MSSAYGNHGHGCEHSAAECEVEVEFHDNLMGKCEESEGYSGGFEFEPHLIVAKRQGLVKLKSAA